MPRFVVRNGTNQSYQSHIIPGYQSRTEGSSKLSENFMDGSPAPGKEKGTSRKGIKRGPYRKGK